MKAAVLKSYRQDSQKGLTLLLAILVLSSVLAISFSIATILFVEVRTSGDLLRTEPALYGAQAISEEAIYKIKRHVSAGFSYTDKLGNVVLNSPPPQESVYTNPILTEKVAAGTTFVNTPNHYVFNDPNNPTQGSNYGRVRLTYLSTGNSDHLTVYICEFDPNKPYNPSGNYPAAYTTIVCTDPYSTEYWLATAKGSNISPNTPESLRTWDLDPTKQQELIIYNSGSTGPIYVQIEAFGPAPNYVPTGIPYVGKAAVNINAENSGVSRKLRVEIPTN